MGWSISEHVPSINKKINSQVNIVSHGRYNKTESKVTGYSHYNKSQPIVEIEGGYADY